MNIPRPVFPVRCSPPSVHPELCQELYTDRGARYPDCCPRFECPQLSDYAGVFADGHRADADVREPKQKKKHKQKLTRKL